MSTLKRFRKTLEIVLARLGFLLIPPLPRKLILMLARAGGALAACMPSQLRKIARANIDLAYGDTLPRHEKDKILRQSYQTFALVLFDIFWFSKQPDKRIPDRVRFDPDLNELFTSQPHICITAHLGNWELLGHAVSLKGYPLHSVAAPLANPAVEPLFHRIRSISGQHIIPRQGAIRGMLKILKEGGKVGLLLDQNTKPSEGGIFVDFFGRPAPISDAAAALALRTGSDILFGFCIPEWDGTYHVHTADKLSMNRYQTLNKAEAVNACTRDIARVIEEAIRVHPGAWLWMYKRWKFYTSGADPADYPFYARKLNEKEDRRG